MFIKNIKNIFWLLTDFSITEIYEKSISNLSKDLNLLLKHYCKDLDMPEVWSKEKSLEIEIKKSVLRSSLRYSNVGNNFSKVIAKILSKNKKRGFDKLKFHSYIYPLIHLPKDQSEEGTLHTDQNRFDRLMTIWTPITQYEYAGITYLPYLGSIYLIAEKIFKIRTSMLIKIFSIIIKKRYSKKGFSYYWGGGLIHKGMINTSKNISAVVVLRLSEKRHIYEESGEIYSLKNKNFTNKQETKLEYLNIKNQYDDMLEIIEFIKKFDSDNDLIKNFKLILQFKHKYFPIINKKLSFSLSLLAQRLQTKQKCFDKKLIKPILENIYILDLLSLLIGNENLVSLERIKNKFPNNHNQITNFLNKNT